MSAITRGSTAFGESKLWQWIVKTPGIKPGVFHSLNSN